MKEFLKRINSRNYNEFLLDPINILKILEKLK